MVLFEKARHGMENALHGKKVNITEAKKAKKKSMANNIISTNMSIMNGRQKGRAKKAEIFSKNILK